MFVDMHIHERTFSPDSMQSLKEIVETARQRGLDAICITDHDSMGLREYAEKYSEETGFPIFVGVEYYSLQGDILAFGIDSIPDTRIDAQDFVDYVSEQGGISFSCHPFRNNQRGLEHGLADIKGMTGVEVLNGSTHFEANQLAYHYSSKLNLMPIGASDAHNTESVGKYATWIPNTVSNTADFIQEIKNGVSCPAIYNGNGYSLVNNAYFSSRIVAD